MKKVTLDDVEIILSNPLSNPTQWIGQQEPLRQLLACWICVDDQDLPLTPRIIGPPGIGKTTLAIAAGASRKQDIYIVQCTSDTRPEDLLITPVLSEKGAISYHASPLLSAAITGGIAILDEGNRMAEKSWASLAGLFDNRRTAESIVAGVMVNAHKEFRATVTMNEDSSTFEIPDYIMSRLQPGIEIGFPNRDDEIRILSYNLPFSSEDVLNLCVNYLQRAHGFDLPYSVRDGINAIRYTLKQQKSNPEANVENLFFKAIEQILGSEALDLDSLAEKRKMSGEHLPNMHMGDFFFPEDDDLNPDKDEDPPA
ncbi:MAG: AAA domain-containing protein [Chitinivibrionales bacterium]|nr:AAA domain-containing protein [Chitinivibrionales bacterium]